MVTVPLSTSFLRKWGDFMATTRLISMHQNHGKTIADCLGDRIDYANNPDKTEGGTWVSAYQCNPEIAQGEFAVSKRMYEDKTHRKQGHTVIAYHLRQSFKPGEITPALANEIGYELAKRLTKGNHAFMVATHTDKAHIHNHIIFNSTSLNCTRKFRDFKGSGRAVANISDRLCLEHGLSIVENPKRSKTNYGKWLGDGKPLSHSEMLRRTIDEILSKPPKNSPAFLQEMQAAGYEIRTGKYLAFKSPNQKKFTRLRSLGEDYSEDAIRAVIEGKAPARAKPKATVKQEKPFSLMIDIQAKLQEGKGTGYENWAQLFNIKQMSQTVIYLQNNNLLAYPALEKKAKEVTDNFHDINSKIKAAEKRLAEIAVLQKHIGNYAKTKDVYTAYRKAGYSQKFYEAHRQDLTLHKAAKAAFDQLELKKLPSMQSLKTEYATLLTEKKQAYSHYAKAKKEMQEVTIAKANLDRLLNKTPTESPKEKSQKRR